MLSSNKSMLGLTNQCLAVRHKLHDEHSAPRANSFLQYLLPSLAAAASAGLYLSRNPIHGDIRPPSLNY
jgi:hypothetical protein